MSTSSEKQAAPSTAPKKKPVSSRFLIWMTQKFWKLFLVYTMTLVIGGTLFNLVEPEKFTEYEGLMAFARSTYWAAVTALSVGYGDIYPSTLVGMILFFFFAHLWIWLFLSAIVVTVLRKVMPDPHQFTHDEQKWIILVLLMICGHLGLNPPPPPKDTEDGDVVDAATVAELTK